MLLYFDAEVVKMRGGGTLRTEIVASEYLLNRFVGAQMDECNCWVCGKHFLI
jgi:hypothetical protein